MVGILRPNLKPLLSPQLSLWRPLPSVLMVLSSCPTANNIVTMATALGAGAGGGQGCKGIGAQGQLPSGSGLVPGAGSWPTCGTVQGLPVLCPDCI